VSSLDADEELVLFPSYGVEVGDGAWRLRVHGWVFEPEESSLKRRGLLSLLRRALDVEKRDPSYPTLKRRAARFLVDNERGEDIVVRIAGSKYAAGRSSENGHFRASVVLDAAKLGSAIGRAARGGDVVPITAVLPAGDKRVLGGEAQLIGPVGTSVISDIDDTVKVSEVLDRKALMANTFLRPFRAVPGMAALYSGWAGRGAVFHYLSSSPWQLFQPLHAFLKKEGFPRGTVHLRHFRWTDSTFFHFFKASDEHKLFHIAALLKTFPSRRFVLVGDSGERDPEIYGQAARDYPGRIAHIAIRRVKGGDHSKERLDAAFKDVPAQVWTLFDRPAGLVELVRPAKPGPTP